MNNVIHVVHAKSKHVFFTITITSPVDAIHYPCSQLESAAQSLSPQSIALRVVKYASRESVPCRMVRNWAMLQIPGDGPSRAKAVILIKYYRIFAIEGRA